MHFLQTICLLAEDPTYMQMGRNFREGSQASRTMEVAVFAAGLVGLIFVMWLTHRLVERHKERQKTSPDALFIDLCRAHRLKRRDRRQLRSFAKNQLLPHPAMVFVTPDRLSDEEIEKCDQRMRDSLVDIRTRLFGATFFSAGRPTA